MAQNLKINILAQDKTKQAFNGIRGKLAVLRGAVFNLRTAFATLGAGLVAKSFVTTGRSIEDLNVRLKQLFGSASEGAKAFEVMANFAGKVPFSLEQIQEASGNLAVVSGDADRLAKILEITGNVASVTGIDFRTAGEQIQRSFAGGIASADIFREKGVRDMLGFKAGATVTAEDTIKAFERVFGKGGKFGNATDELATTFTGTLSMLGDKLFNFKKNVAGAQFFDTLKKEFSNLNKFIEENSKDFEAIANAIGFILTLAVKGFASAVRGVGKAVNFLRTTYENLIHLLNKIPFVNIEIGKTQDKINIGAGVYQHIIDNTNSALKETNKSLVQVKDNFTKIGDVIKKDMDKLTDTALLVSKVLEMGIKGFSRGLAESIVLGKELKTTFKDLARTLLVEVLSTIIEIIARETVLLAIEKAKTKQKIFQSQISSGGGLLQSIGKVFGFAKGGAVSKGQPIVVGENGAEMFIPNSTGQITQSARGTGNGGATTVNFNINTVDASGFEELLVRSRGTITQLINNAVNERGSGNLI
jgi:hypothetical protein